MQVSLMYLNGLGWSALTSGVFGMPKSQVEQKFKVATSQIQTEFTFELVIVILSPMFDRKAAQMKRGAQTSNPLK